MNLSVGRQRDARIYRRMAAWARRNGHRRVTRHAVRKWVVSGLLPRAKRIPVGWGPPAIAQDVRTGRQLLRLCRYRYRDRLGRLDVVAGNLLLDGFTVDLVRVRHAMVWAHESLAADARRRAARHGRRTRSSLVRSLADAPIVVAGMRGLDFLTRQLLLDELGSLAAGASPSRFAQAAIRRATGATPRLAARTSSLISRPTAREVRRALNATDQELIEAAELVVAEPGVMAGIEDYRSARTRSVYRLVMFTALVRHIAALRRPIHP